MAKKDTSKAYRRKIIKALIYRVYSTIITFGLGMAITGSLKISITIGIIDLLKTIFYYIFELIYK